MTTTNETIEIEGADNIRETDHYRDEYIKDFVSKWDELIDWKRRSTSEGSFFIDLLRENNVLTVLDVATGTGFHSVRLLDEGFKVTSADGSPDMLERAFLNARRHGHLLSTVHADWRYLNRDVHGEFDAIICLGNSFTHLFSERDRRKALAEYYAMLKHDGVLIIDQRNYDVILGDEYSTTHKYYYCGQDVEVAPEYVDEGLARFRYRFPDDSVFHLNMFPLRKSYLRKLLYDVGFQHVETYGDFQENCHDGEADFFIHVAQKRYTAREHYSETVDTARSYYNSSDADTFYFRVWGGEDIHIGMYGSDDEPIFDASHRTVETIENTLDTLDRSSAVIDLGAGFGGAARHLAKKHGCRVVALNLSEVQNRRNEDITCKQGLDHLIEVADESFEEVPYADESFDVVWSQDAFLHSGNREKVIAEAARLLKPGGELVFTDPMQADDCPEGVLQPILDRILLDTLGSPDFYKEAAGRHGLEFVSYDEHTEQLVNHYSRVLQETESREKELVPEISQDYIDRMKKGLRHWVEGGKKGWLTWGILHFRKK